jgi:hypothetical protein
MSAAPFSHWVAVDAIPEAGRHVHFEAGETERRALAAALDIVGIVELTANMHVARGPQGAVTVRGTVRGTVVQTDVVTLEPVTQQVAEPVDVTLLPGDRPRAEQRGPAGAPEVEAPDAYQGGRIDLGAIAGEHLALSLDPYPRAAGVEFQQHIEDQDSDAASPFAALARLKGDRN